LAPSGFFAFYTNKFELKYTRITHLFLWQNMYLYALSASRNPCKYVKADFGKLKINSFEFKY